MAMQIEDWFGRPGNAAVVGEMFYGVASPADRFSDAIDHNTDPRKRIWSAVLAVKADPGCIDAHIFLASCVKDRDVALLHLRQAVAEGERLWNPVAEDEGQGMRWWGFAATRPYMRAIQALGLAHRDAGDIDDARDCFERLLAMNPEDNQGIRFSLEEMDGLSTPGLR